VYYFYLIFELRVRVNGFQEEILFLLNLSSLDYCISVIVAAFLGYKQYHHDLQASNQERKQDQDYYFLPCIFVSMASFGDNCSKKSVELCKQPFDLSSFYL
jgi:hypothetical protein